MTLAGRIFRDPMLRLLVVAIVLAVVVPAQGQGRVAAQWVANGAVFVLFLLNGMKIARAEVAAGIGNARFLAPLALWVFGAMALIGWALGTAGRAVLAPELALGFLFLGTLTSTVQSATSYSALAGGNVALSVVSAALLNVMGVFVTLPVLALLGGGAQGVMGWESAGKVFALLILPFAIGQVLQPRVQGFVARRRGAIVWSDRLAIAIAVYVAFSGAVAEGIASRVSGADWAWLLALTGAFLALGHVGAWITGGLIGLPRADRIAFLFAGAQKSAAVGAPLATLLFAPADAGFVVMPLLLYHLFQLVAAAPLASRLAATPPPPRDGGDASGPTTTATGRSESRR